MSHFRVRSSFVATVNIDNYGYLNFGEVARGLPCALPMGLASCANPHGEGGEVKTRTLQNLTYWPQR